MFLDFFLELKKFKVPVSLDEFLSFLNALKLDLVQYNVNNFYFLAKASLIKDEKLYDRFDAINTIRRVIMAILVFLDVIIL